MDLWCVCIFRAATRQDRDCPLALKEELAIILREAVLDKGYVQIEEYMGGDAAVVRGARICYQSVAHDPQADARLIRRLMASEPKHNTVFEHSVFRFGVKCPIFVARQWLRHRIGTFNEKSLRYCTADREYYVPQGEPNLDAYIQHMEASFDLYEKLVAAGWRKERARGVLGTAVYTEFIWTVNFWSLANWLNKRLDPASQWEHRQYAHAILHMVAQVMPISTSAFVATLPEKTIKYLQENDEAFLERIL